MAGWEEEEEEEEEEVEPLLEKSPEEQREATGGGGGGGVVLWGIGCWDLKTSEPMDTQGGIFGREERGSPFAAKDTYIYIFLL